MKPRTISSIALVIASMSLAMPLLIGMAHISSRLFAHGLAAVAACFIVWAIAAVYLVYHFMGKAQEKHQE